MTVPPRPSEVGFAKQGLTLMRLACRFEDSRPILQETEANSSASKILGCDLQDMKVGSIDAEFAFELECGRKCRFYVRIRQSRPSFLEDMDVSEMNGDFNAKGGCEPVG